MRAIPLLLTAAAMAGCATAPQSAQRSAEAQAELQQLLAGRVAGPAMTCLPSYRSGQMVVIDDNTLAFRDGSRVYVNNLRGACSGLGSGFYTLVTRSFGGGLCRGDIADVADPSTGMVYGSCVIGDFVPYART